MKRCVKSSVLTNGQQIRNAFVGQLIYIEIPRGAARSRASREAAAFLLHAIIVVNLQFIVRNSENKKVLFRLYLRETAEIT